MRGCIGHVILSVLLHKHDLLEVWTTFWKSYSSVCFPGGLLREASYVIDRNSVSVRDQSLGRAFLGCVKNGGRWCLFEPNPLEARV